jgi:hypothetical protein
MRLIGGRGIRPDRQGGTLSAGGEWNAAPAADPDPPPAGRVLAGRVRRKLDRSTALAIEEAGLTDVAAHLVNQDPTGRTGNPRNPPS